MVAEDISPGGAAGAMLPERITVLLIEDDDGDAMLVEELLPRCSGVRRSSFAAPPVTR